MPSSLVDRAAAAIQEGHNTLTGVGQPPTQTQHPRQRVVVNGVTFEVFAPDRATAEAAVKQEIEARPHVLSTKALEQGLRFDPETRQATEVGALSRFAIGMGRTEQEIVNATEELVATIQGDVPAATAVATQREQEQEVFDLLDDRQIGAEDVGQVAGLLLSLSIPARALRAGSAAGSQIRNVLKTAAGSATGLSLLRIAASLRWNLNPAARRFGRNAQTVKEWVQEGRRLGLKPERVEKALQTPQGRQAIEQAAKAEPSPAVARATARKLDQAAKRVDKEKGPSGATERRLEAIRDRQRDVRARSAKEARQGQEQAARSTQRKAEEIRQNPQGIHRDVSAERLAARKENRALLRDLIKKAETGRQ